MGEMFQWPLSQKNLSERIAETYDGVCCTTYNFGYSDSRSLVNKFKFGEKIIGSETNISGTLRYVRPEVGQLIITDIESIDLEFFKVGETLVGQESGDQIIIDKCVRWEDGIFNYYNKFDGRQENNPNFIDCGVGFELSNITYGQSMQIQNEQLRYIRVLRPTSIGLFEKTVKDLLRV